jgi:hypothetical protein
LALTRKDNWEVPLNRPTEKKLIQKFMMIDGKLHETHRVIVHKITMGDVEDPDLYVAQPIYEWQQTDMGKFVMERALDEPMWHRQADPINWGHQYAISAYLKDTDYTFWQLKWGTPS